jgi:hypothetical protein
MQAEIVERPRAAGHLSRALEWAWRRGIATRPDLESKAIVAAAARRSGICPEDGSWHARLEILCRSLLSEAELNSFGHTVAFGQLVKLVAARARANRLLAKYPGVARFSVSRPVLVVGQMRSGTTRVHRLLACDPQFEVNRLYDQLDPVPYEGIDLRRARAVFASRLLKAIDPALASTHPVSSSQPEEDFGLQAFSIWGAQFEGQWRVPSFVRHLEGADPSDAYSEFRLLLQIHKFARKSDENRCWLLKAPQFAQDLDAVLSAFPDARLVVLRRDPAEVIASSASLVWHHARLMSDSVTPEEIGKEWLRKTRFRAERMENALRRHSNVERVELRYAEVSNDWRGSMAKVYAMLGRPLDNQVERKMARFVDRSVAHRNHRYRAADFGLIEPRVAEEIT